MYFFLFCLLGLILFISMKSKWNENVCDTMALIFAFIGAISGIVLLVAYPISLSKRGNMQESRVLLASYGQYFREVSSAEIPYEGAIYQPESITEAFLLDGLYLIAQKYNSALASNRSNNKNWFIGGFICDFPRDFPYFSAKFIPPSKYSWYRDIT